MFFLKQRSIRSVCLVCLCFFGFSSLSQGQFENNPIAQALDLTTRQVFSDRYRVRSDDFTKGGSSLEVLPSLSPTSGVTGGYFVEDFVTVTFDYKYTQNDSSVSEDLEFTYGSPDGILAKLLPDTNGEWCTRSYYVGANVGSVQWTILFEQLSGETSEVLFDNFRIEAGNNVQDWECNKVVEPPVSRVTNSARAVVPMLSLLLLQDGSDQPSEPTEPDPFSVFGEISLPSGMVAPVGGLEVEIFTFPIDFRFQDLFIESSRVTIEIPQGQQKSDYRLPFLVSGVGLTRQIEYSCIKGCQELGLATGGFWSTVTGTTDFFGATDFDVNSSSNVPITLEAADSFTGSIAFPVGQVATGDEQIVVNVREVISGFGFPITFSFYYYPEAGDTQIALEIGVPTDSSSNGWVIDIRCNGCSDALADGPQYVVKPSGYALVGSASTSYRFASGTDFDNVDVVLLTK